MLEKVKEIRKTLVAFAGVVAALLTANILPTEVAQWATILLSILTVFGVYQVPNVTTDPIVPDPFDE